MLAMAALACASGANASAGAPARSFPAAGITALSVDAPAGNVEVSAGGDGLEVELTNFDPARCSLTLASKDGVLLLKASTKSRSTLLRKGCAAGFKVNVPAAPAAGGEPGAGSALFDGLSGRAQS